MVATAICSVTMVLWKKNRISSLQSHRKALEKECCLPDVFCDSGDTPANLLCELNGHLMPSTSCFCYYYYYKLVSRTEHIPSSCLCFPNGSSPLLGETCPQCRRLSCCCSWRGVVGGIISGTSIVVVVEFSLASTAVGRFVFLYVLWVETIRIPRAYGCRPSGGASIRR